MLPHSLSRGQRQRLAVASILSMEPDIIVLDEPTTGQDRGHLNKFLTRMKMLNKAGKTIILISHDMGVVAEYASRTIVMKDGGILMDAGTREVFSRPDVLEEASIEPYLLARACNDVRGAGCSCAADCGGDGAVCWVGVGWVPHLGRVNDPECRFTLSGASG